MPTENLIFYEQTNKLLVTVPDAFARREESVLSWVWREGVEVGAEIEAGSEVADIQWDNNEREAIAAPANCSGKIKAVNPIGALFTFTILSFENGYGYFAEP